MVQSGMAWCGVALLKSGRTPCTSTRNDVKEREPRVNFKGSAVVRPAEILLRETHTVG